METPHGQALRAAPPDRRGPAGELVSNACRDARSPVLLTVELDRTTVTARVWDDGSELPRVLPRSSGPGDVHRRARRVRGPRNRS